MKKKARRCPRQENREKKGKTNRREKKKGMFKVNREYVWHFDVYLKKFGCTPSEKNGKAAQGGVDKQCDFYKKRIVIYCNLTWSLAAQIQKKNCRDDCFF